MVQCNKAYKSIFLTSGQITLKPKIRKVISNIFNSEKIKYKWCQKIRFVTVSLKRGNGKDLRKFRTRIRANDAYILRSSFSQTLETVNLQKTEKDGYDSKEEKSPNRERSKKWLQQ